ncbi:hypothetical protein COCNU_scaffold041201G000030 [Cocos nucifera]|nr:hypothetical protein [Cocos nucifera]
MEVKRAQDDAEEMELRGIITEKDKLIYELQVALESKRERKDIEGSSYEMEGSSHEAIVDVLPIEFEFVNMDSPMILEENPRKKLVHDPYHRRGKDNEVLAHKYRHVYMEVKRAQDDAEEMELRGIITEKDKLIYELQVALESKRERKDIEGSSYEMEGSSHEAIVDVLPIEFEFVNMDSPMV